MLDEEIKKLEKAIAEIKAGYIGTNAAKIRYYAARVSMIAISDGLPRRTAIRWDITDYNRDHAGEERRRFKCSECGGDSLDRDGDCLACGNPACEFGFCNDCKSESGCVKIEKTNQDNGADVCADCGGHANTTVPNDCGCGR